MTERYAARQMNIADMETKTPPLLLPDAASTADFVVNQALEYCAQKMGLGAAWLAVDQLKQDEPTACNYCRYSMAKQTAEALGTLDENVKAVYVYEYDATPEDLSFSEGPRTDPIHLLVWVDRKTNALTSLVAAFDQNLARSVAEVMDKYPMAHMLDVQVVDDTDVETHTGYGALFSSLYNRPLKVWER